MLLLLHYLMVALDCKSLGYLNPATLLPTLESRYTSLLDLCRQGTLRAGDLPRGTRFCALGAQRVIRIQKGSGRGD